MFDFISNLPTITTLWVGGGVLLIFAEFFIPGTFVAFLGTSGIITGIVVYFLIFPSVGNLDFGLLFPRY